MTNDTPHLSADVCNLKTGGCGPGFADAELSSDYKRASFVQSGHIRK